MSNVAGTTPTMHRFNVLPYQSDRPDILVVICDCGWGDIMSADHGSGWDAAVQYAHHLQAGEAVYASYSGDPEVLIGAARSGSSVGEG